MPRYCSVAPLPSCEYCSNNALHPLSLLFTMFIFHLSSFNTWECYYCESNVAYTGVTYKKKNVTFCSLLNMKK